MWTETRVEELKAMWLAGMTASECAAALDVTRNAAIGKVHRLGLSSDSHTRKGGGRKKRFDHDAILTMWANGASRRAIAAELGCSRNTVSIACREGRSQNDPRAVRREKRISGDIRAAIVAAYPPRPSIAEVAERFGVSASSVIKIVANARKAA